MRNVTLFRAAGGGLLASLSALCLVAAPTTVRGAIDRHALVTRHNIEWNDLRGQVPLGNGEFCFNADATGLQTFGGSTLSHWAWQSATSSGRHSWATSAAGFAHLSSCNTMPAGQVVSTLATGAAAPVAGTAAAVLLSMGKR